MTNVPLGNTPDKKEPPLNPRDALVLLIALIVGTLVGFLWALAGRPIPECIILGMGAAVLAGSVANKIIG